MPTGLLPTGLSVMGQVVLAGSAEIARFLDISRQRVTQLQAYPEFPEPLACLAMGKVYDFAAIERWAIETGRRITFREWWDDRIKDMADSEPDPDDLDVEGMTQDFADEIARYGYTFENAIPGTYAEMLALAW